MKKDLRIVSLLPSATEIVCALGLEENLVGVTHECDYPASVENKPRLTASKISHETMTSAEIDHAVRRQLDGHGSIYDLDEKMLAELKPDLILTQELCDVCAVSYKTVARAARMYAADAQVVSLEPNTIGDIFENIKLVGELCSVSEKAAEVVTNLQKRLENLRAKISETDKRPRVFMLEWLEPPFAPGHWVPEQVAAAGGECLLGETGKPSVTTDYEKIVEARAEILVLIPCGYYAADVLRQLPNTVFPESLQTLPAIQNGEVWALDATSYFSRPAPRVVDGAEILARVVHPEICGAPSETEAIRVSGDLLKFAKAAN